MSKDAYWFKHDSNATNDVKIMQLLAEYGLEGYGAYWIIIEKLRDATGYKYPKDKLKGLAWSLRKDEDWIIGFIGFCVEVGLFKEDEKHFWSDSLIKRVDSWESAKEKRSEAAIAAGKASAAKRNALKRSKKSTPEKPNNQIDLTNAEQGFKDCSMNTEQRFNDYATESNLLEERREEERREEVGLKKEKKENVRAHELLDELNESFPDSMENWREEFGENNFDEWIWSFCKRNCEKEWENEEAQRTHVIAFLTSKKKQADQELTKSERQKRGSPASNGKKTRRSMSDAIERAERHSDEIWEESFRKMKET